MITYAAPTTIQLQYKCNTTTIQLKLNVQDNCKTTTIPFQYNYNTTTIQLQDNYTLQLQYNQKTSAIQLQQNYKKTTNSEENTTRKIRSSVAMNILPKEKLGSEGNLTQLLFNRVI